MHARPYEIQENALSDQTNEPSPQKHRVWPRVVAFLVALTAAFAFVNAFVQPIWPDPNWGNASRTAFYEEPENTIQCIFVGASTFVSGISPLDLYEEYGINTYNLGSEQQPTMASYFWIKEAYRLHPQSLKTVVLDASMLRYVPIDARYHKALDCMALSDVKLEALASWTNNPADFLACLSPIASYHDRWAEADDSDFYKFGIVNQAKTRGFSPTYQRVLDGMSPEDAAQAAEVVDLPLELPAPPEDLPTLDREALSYLDKIVHFCSEKGIRLILMRTPIAEVGWGANNHYAVQYLCDSYGVPYLDYCYEPLYDSANFSLAADTIDSGHLNYYGAMKLTHALGAYLATLEPFHNANASPSSGDSTIQEQINTWRIERLAVERQWKEPGVVQYLRDSATEGRTVFVAVRDDAATSLTESQRAMLASMGLSKLSELEFHDSYLAVIEDSKVSYEDRKQDLLTAINGGGITTTGVLPDGTTYALTSGGFNQGNVASVVIGGVEYARNQRGINIVVYDTSCHKVIASTFFDTYAQAYRAI